MFGSSKEKKDPGKGVKPVPSTNSLNSLVAGTNVEGKIKATSDIRIDGLIKGELHCDAKVIIGPEGKVEGTILCQNAVIEGKFDGILVVEELLNIRENARVTGDVKYGKLNVQAGAVIIGTYELSGKGLNGMQKTADAHRSSSSSAGGEHIPGKSESGKEKARQPQPQ